MIVTRTEVHIQCDAIGCRNAQIFKSESHEMCIDNARDIGWILGNEHACPTCVETEAQARGIRFMLSKWDDESDDSTD